MLARYELPLPPSLWDMYQGHGKGKHLSDTYNNWRNGAGLMLNAQRRGRQGISVPFRVQIAFSRSSSLSDIDNRIKPVLDLLQFVGVVSNDRLCESVEAKWASDLPAACVVIIQQAEEELAA